MQIVISSLPPSLWATITWVLNIEALALSSGVDAFGSWVAASEIPTRKKNNVSSEKNVCWRTNNQSGYAHRCLSWRQSNRIWHSLHPAAKEDPPEFQAGWCYPEAVEAELWASLWLGDDNQMSEDGSMKTPTTKSVLLIQCTTSHNRKWILESSIVLHSCCTRQTLPESTQYLLFCFYSNTGVATTDAIMWYTVRGWISI